MKTYRTIGEAYVDQLRLTYEYPDFKPCPHGHQNQVGYIPNGGGTRERLGVVFKVTKPAVTKGMFNTIKDPNRAKLMHDYMFKEIELFDGGVIDADIMAHHSKLWGRIANPDGTINANYGYMAYHLQDASSSWGNRNDMTQYQFALKNLSEDLDTRQAYLHFNRPKDQYLGNKDQPCTVFVQFIVRDRFVHMYSYMRSNDLVFGTPYNLGYFAHMLDRLVKDLNQLGHKVYKGWLQHSATSLHIYERHFNKVEKMLYAKEREICK